MISVARKLLIIGVIVFAMVGLLCVRAYADGRPYIGMQPQELPKKALVALGLEKTGAIMIRDVGRNTPAGTAGVRPGDILLTFGGSEVSTLADLIDKVGNFSPGDVIELSIRRDDETHDLQIVAGVWPESQSLEKSSVGQVPAIGVTLVGLTKDVRDQFSLRWDSQGLLVTLVDPSKGISEIVMRGDVVVQVNQQDVWLPQQVIDIYNEAKAAGQRQILVLLERPDGNAMIMLPVK